MKNFLLLYSIVITSLFLLGANPFQETKTVYNFKTVYDTVQVSVVDTLHHRDTIQVFDHYKPSFTQKDLILMVKYIKTQTGNNLDGDSWGVIQTMVNRLVYKGCTMREYFAKQSLNNSKTILKIKRGVKIPNFSFSWSNHKDIAIYYRILDVLSGNVPEEFRFPPNVLYFESHPKSWNKKPKGAFDRKMIYAEYQHEFYLMDYEQFTKKCHQRKINYNQGNVLVYSSTHTQTKDI